MKILFVPMLPTLYGRRYQLCKHLAASGNEVHMILWQMPYPITYESITKSFKNSWKKESYKQDGIYIHKVRRLPFFFPFINRAWFQKQLKEISKNFDIKVVLSQSFFHETEPPKQLALYFDLNDNYEAFAKIYGSPLYKLSYKLLRVRHTVVSQLRRAETVFAVSDRLVDYARIFNDNVYKVPNGVDIPKIKQSPKELRYGENSLVYVSTFGKWSGILETIQVVRKLKDKIPNIKLILIGSGTELKAAEKLIEKMSAKGYIKLLGPLHNREKMFDIVRNCKVCLNISDKNAFRDAASPIKVFEYSALGKTVVSTDLDEVKSLALPNVILYSTDNQSANLETAIVRALNVHRNNSDVQRKIIDKYNWDYLTAKMVKVIQSKSI